MQHFDIRTADDLRRRLPPSLQKMQIFVYEKTDSTMTRAKLFAKEHGEDAIFIAREQSEGVGRLDRSFCSPEDRGLYASFLIHFPIDASRASLLTPLVAVCLCRVLRALTPLEPKIKWVNDIYIGERKLAGILTRAELSEGSLSYAIIGVGLNVLGRTLPEEIADIATTVELECGKALSVASLAAALTEELYASLPLVGSKEIADEYRKESMLTGRRVTVNKIGASYPATVVGISDSLELLLRLDDGGLESLGTGEVSIRL